MNVAELVEKITKNWWSLFTNEVQGACEVTNGGPCMIPGARRAIAEAIKQAILEERERCAKAVEDFKTGGPDPETVLCYGKALAALIREGRMP